MAQNNKKEEKAVVLGKAVFTDFDKYAEWCLTEEADDFFSIKNMWTGCMYELQGEVPGIVFSKIHDMVKPDSWRKERCNEIVREKQYVEPLKKCIEYMEMFSSDETTLKFDLIYEHKDMFDIVSFGTYQFIVPKWAIEKELFKDYSGSSLAELRVKGLAGKEGLVPTGSQLATMSQLAVRDQISEAEALQLAYNAEKDDIENARVKGLEELQREIEEKQAELEARKQALLEMFYKKQALLEEKMKQLKTELYVLESEIYSIRCFLGEVVDFIQLRKGNAAPVDAPITLFQKIRFLDDELGKLVSVYDFDFNDAKLFEKLLQSRDDILDVFCPNDKCVSLVRVSKTGTYWGYDDVGEMLKEYEVYHGLRIGILVRNGENLYMGWTDEEKINIPDDMFYAPGAKVVNSEDAGETTSIEEAVSRYFIFSILQGALENKQMLTLPEGVKADFSKPSEYIIYSVADTWLCDNRYGTFDEMIKKCNEKVTAGDYVLCLEWNSDKDGDRGHSEWRNLTRNLSLHDRGIYQIRLVEEDNNEWRWDDYKYYISLKKNWDDDYVYTGGWNRHERKRDAYALFRIYSDEFINLTYMNSTWLKYVITTKNLGDERRRLGKFAEAIRYLNDALKFVKKREKEEYEYIGQYVSEITDDTWVLLTEFKLEKGVRNMNDYQAKRFAKWLENRK